MWYEKGVGMADERFDHVTKLVSTSTTRRGLFKGVAAVALAGLVARVRGSGEAAARARVKMACARLGQPCHTVAGTPGNQVCCPHLVCDTDLTCCTPAGESCVDDADCCGDGAVVCRPNPAGLGGRCLAPGELGAACLSDSDCASTTCDGYTATCVAGPCYAGVDPETGSAWTVCRADSGSAWVSSTANVGGTFHLEQICQQLGYRTFSNYGGTCGSTCGYCAEPTASCSAPGTETYDGQGLRGEDVFGFTLAGGVMWECVA
jgi:hypothetical protein